MPYREDDLNLLLPSMRVEVEGLKADLTAEGFEVCVRDTVRTATEAAANAAKGTGIADSIHIYGAAADLICNRHGWQCKAKRCRFFDRLDALARKRGLVRVHVRAPNGQRYLDQPHVQGIPVEWQNAMRALGTGPESVAARDALVRKHLAKR